MNILRRIGLSLSVFVFSSALSVFVIIIGVCVVFGTPDALKDSLRQSGLYSVLLQTAAMQQPANQGQNDVQQEALVGALTPEFAQRIVEGFIDNTYSYAQGKSA